MGSVRLAICASGEGRSHEDPHQRSGSGLFPLHPPAGKLLKDGAMIKIEISPAPRNMNRIKGHHWAKYQREKQRIRKEIYYQLPMFSEWPDPPFDIQVHRIGWSKMDPTGVIESMKPVLDSLVDLGFLPHDRDGVIDNWRVTQEICRKKRGASKLVIVFSPTHGTDQKKLGKVEKSA